MRNSEVETYYLSKDVPKFVKNLSELKTPWEREIAGTLLNQKLNEKEKLLRILAALPEDEDAKEKEKRAEVEHILELLPKQIRSRSRILMRHLLKRVSLDDGDLVVLPGVGPTAPLIDVLRFFASPRYLKLPLLQQTADLSEFFISQKFPMSAFGSGVMELMNELVNSSASDNLKNSGDQISDADNGHQEALSSIKSLSSWINL